jgi:hypothetical protein
MAGTAGRWRRWGGEAALGLVVMVLLGRESWDVSLGGNRSPPPSPGVGRSAAIRPQPGPAATRPERHLP